MIEKLIALHIIIPIFTAISCVAFQRGARLISCLGGIALFIISVSLFFLLYSSANHQQLYNFGGWATPFGIEFKVNLYNSIMSCLVSLCALGTILWGVSFSTQIEQKENLFMALLFACILGFFGILMTNDFFNMYVFIEIASLSTYALVAVGKDKSALKAAFYYLIVGTIGATFILIGIAYLYAASATLNISDFISKLPKIKDLHSTYIGINLIFVGLLIKGALFPFHTWLVKVYKTTNHIALSFMSGTATKVYIFAFMKIYFLASDTYPQIGTMLIYLGAFSAIVFSVIAIRQKDLRSLLTFSSLSQLSYIFIIVGTNTPYSMYIAVMYIFGHSIAKMSLFMISGHAYEKNQSYALDTLTTFFRNNPLMSILFVINAASIVGIPLTFGFYAKAAMILNIIYVQSWWVLSVAILGTLLTFKYMWNVIEAIISNQKTTLLVIDKATIVIALITALNISLGILAFIYSEKGVFMAKIISPLKSWYA